MNNRLGVSSPCKLLSISLMLGGLAASPAFAGDSATLKCVANQDRVWVYDSLNSFDVAAKLRCGETVEITGRVKGYVKIRAANGSEGYVPESTFPNLPPFVDPNDASTDRSSLASRVAPRPATRSAAAPATTATITVTVAPAAVPAPVPTAKPTVVASSNPAAPPARAAVAPPVSTVRTVSETSPASAAPSAPTPAPAATPGVRSSSTPAPYKKSNSVASASTKPQPAPSAAAHAPALTSTSASTSSKSTSPAASSKAASTRSGAAQPQPAGGAHPAPTPSVPPPAASTSTKTFETTANAQPSREMASVHTVSATESDEYPADQPENASADPACQVFFSAYGLSPAQFKWIAQNRKKQFSSICPAPDPSKIDYVIIFTHDVDFFGSTLPTIVHT
ncbi:MAG: SH3 domain-containing protein, partial [Candidatus Acidiferrales bacterium]